MNLVYSPNNTYKPGTGVPFRNAVDSFYLNRNWAQDTEAIASGAAKLNDVIDRYDTLFSNTSTAKDAADTVNYAISKFTEEKKNITGITRRIRVQDVINRLKKLLKNHSEAIELDRMHQVGNANESALGPGTSNGGGITIPSMGSAWSQLQEILTGFGGSPTTPPPSNTTGDGSLGNGQNTKTGFPTWGYAAIGGGVLLVGTLAFIMLHKQTQK